MDYNKIIKSIEKRVHLAMEALGDKGLKQLKKAVSIPYPPASDPYNDPHLRTGYLRDELKVETEKLTTTYSSNAPYAVPLEFGHNIVRGGKIVGYVQPRPYMRNFRSRIAKTYIDDLKKEL